MELDEMKQAWQTLNRRLEEQQALNLQLFRDGKLDKAHRRLRPLRWGQRLQILGGALLMLWAGSFWTAHLDNLHYLVYGLSLHLYGLLLVLTAARNLYLQSRLDYAAPVLEIQRRLAALRVWRLQEAVIYGVTGCFVWVPLLFMLFALSGADVWANSPAVVWGNLAAGLGCLALFYGLIVWSRRPGWGRLRAALEGSSIGRSVRDTQLMLEELARFEQA